MVPLEEEWMELTEEPLKNKYLSFNHSKLEKEGKMQSEKKGN